MKVQKRARKALTLFLQAWKRMDHQEIYDQCQLTWTKGKTVEDIKRLFPKKLDGYRVRSYEAVTEVVYDFVVVLTMEGIDRVCRFRLLSEKGAFIPHVDGEFGVNPNSIRDINRINTMGRGD